ncbi:hypothetical protein BDW69DRAFT_194975 [Aspergillus filifer]
MPHVSVASPGTQHPPSTQSQRPATQQPSNTQAMANFVDLVRSIASSSDYHAAEEIFVEVASLQSQLQTKEKELEDVTNKLSEQKTAQQITMREMFNANKIEMSKQEEATSKIESLNQLVQKGKDTISRKEREISDLKDQYKEADSAKSQLKSILKTAQHDIDGLQHKVKEKDILIDRIKTSHSENQKRLKDVEASARDMEKQRAALNTSLQATRARLDKIEGYATQHLDTDEDSMVDAFTNLWQYAITEINPHLVIDLPEEILQSRKAVVEHHVPLPHSNSPAAKQMRLAILLAILAREVDKNIFQPTYLIPEDVGIRKVLANVASYDIERESYYRSIFLSIDPDTQNANLQSRIQAITRQVSSYLYGMLPDDQFEQLRASIEKIVKMAVDVWHPLQRSQQRYEPDFEPLRWGDIEWHPLNFPEGGHTESETRPDTFDESLLTVFPRLTRVEKRNRIPLTWVVQLRRSQPQCMAAGREVSMGLGMAPGMKMTCN